MTAYLFSYAIRDVCALLFIAWLAYKILNKTRRP